jgi:type III restriction enzyme
MKFTLKDFQEDAVKDVLQRLQKARKRWHEDGDKSAFSLTATTGAGKTVMAASVFEALFYGNDEHSFEPDPSAVVVWFSDDPALNAQSLWRLQEASDKLTISDLVTIENTFNRDSLEAGKVYFLNTQKLGKNSLLVRGHDAAGADNGAAGRQLQIMPDLRSFTIWDIIKNTIENPDLTLYLVLDEAHRGMKDGRASAGENKPTIVKQLINGMGSVPGIPIVWGVSATVERFNKAMEGAAGRDTLSHVVVDSKKVQDSGLIKDTLILDVPDELGDFSTVLLRRGTDKLKEISEAWADYCKTQGDTESVVPLMVLQVPNSPDHAEIGGAIDTILARWPELPTGCLANVFGEHKTETFGRHSVPYIEPQRVQESSWVRILIAKDAISTGWDCPRAEVMVSFRAATDKTHITQLLGRMVRTPLARRIPGNDRLNSVDCLLPRFNKAAVEEVAKLLMSGGEAGEELPLRRILINPAEMKPNPAIPAAVWDKLLALPSQTIPKRQSRPVKRLTLLAHELAADNLLADGGKKAHDALHKHLNKAQEQLADQIKKARQSVLDVEGMSVRADIKTGAMTFDQFLEAADVAVIEEAYKRASRIISPDLATTYSEHLASKSALDDEEEALIEAHTAIAALGLVPAIKDSLDAEASRLAQTWLGKYKSDIKKLPDDRQEVYRQIREMSDHPLDIEIARPTVWFQPTKARDPNGTETDLPRFERHMMCDEAGLFPESLNSWESRVVLAELKKDQSIAWYRNPDRATQDSLGVTYEHDSETRIVRPDFIFFSKLPNNEIATDIVDPHGIHLADALPKLKGMAKYAEVHKDVYRRIDVVAEVNGNLKSLDLTKSAVRAAVLTATSAKALYEGATAEHYLA